MTDYPLTRALAYRGIRERRPQSDRQSDDRRRHRGALRPPRHPARRARRRRHRGDRQPAGDRRRAARRTPKARRFPFKEVAAGVDEKHHVAEGYDADILIRWGDPVLPGAPAFDPLKQTAAAQKQQFGYNNDYLGYIPLPGAANPSHHGLLVVNHEYTNEELMFPGIGVGQDARRQELRQA